MRSNDFVIVFLTNKQKNKTHITKDNTSQMISEEGGGEVVMVLRSFACSLALWRILTVSVRHVNHNIGDQLIADLPDGLSEVCCGSSCVHLITALYRIVYLGGTVWPTLSLAKCTVSWSRIYLMMSPWYWYIGLFILGISSNIFSCSEAHTAFLCN